MMTKGFLAILCLIFVSAPAFADVTPEQRQGYMQFCQNIHDAQNRPGANIRFGRILRDLLRLSFAKRKLSPLETISAETPAERRLRLPTAGSRNVIFSMEAPEGIENDPDYLAKKRALDEIRPRLERVRETIVAPLAQTDNVQQCADRAGVMGFRLEEIAELDRIIAEAWQVQRVIEGQQARKVLTKAMRRLDLDWEVVHFTRIGDVVEALKSPTIENVVIITHVEANPADPGKIGTIVDGLRNEYYREAFDALSPSLRTLTIYGCEGRTFVERYNFSNLFNSSPSIHSRREFYYSPGVDFIGQTDVAPLLALKSFLKRVERKIKRLRASDTPAPESASTSYDRCLLNVSGFQATAGTFAWQLNGTVIGVSHSDRIRQSFSFPCSLMDRPRNVLINVSIMLGVYGAVASESFEVKVFVPPTYAPGAPVVEPVRSFRYTPSQGGGYRSSKTFLVLP